MQMTEVNSKIPKNYFCFWRKFLKRKNNPVLTIKMLQQN